jgi:hypothetical protein
MLAARRSAASVAAGCSNVLCRTLGWMAREATVWSCWHSAVLSMLLPTGLICDLCTGTGSQTIGREMLQAGSKAISHKVLAMSAVPVVLHSWSLLLWHTGCTVEESVCLSGAGRQHSNPHARRTRRVWSWSSVSEELAMLGSHSQLAETQCMIQLYLQQQSCNASSACSSCLFWRIPVKQTLHCAACTWLNLSVAQTQCMQQ